LIEEETPEVFMMNGSPQKALVTHQDEYSGL
jgi:hypothetical protein